MKEKKYNKGVASMRLEEKFEGRKGWTSCCYFLARKKKTKTLPYKFLRK